MEVQFLQPGADHPSRALRPRVADGAPGRGGRLLCRRCRIAVALRRDAFEVAGAHLHTRVNPHGFRFRFGCFRQATNLDASAQRSTAWSWFPGHTWQVETCASCGLHLGWLFRACRGEGAFHALLVELLVEEPEAGEGA